MIKHFYHLYADGEWRDATQEHIAALSAIDDNMINLYVLAIGTPRRCDEALAYVCDNLPTSVSHCETRSKADGWEQETLAWLRNDADTYNEYDHPYLYCHTKGAYNTAALNSNWRLSMTRHTVGRWRECLQWLKLVDTIGCHWLTPGQYEQVDTPFYGGNFWWATANYIRRLPPITREDRWEAERWIGRGAPTTHDLYPGWPNFH